MNTSPPLLKDPRKADADQLRLLVIFHYVGAGLSLLGLGFVALHYTFMNMIFNNPKMWAGAKGGPPPAEVFAIFKWFYLIFVMLLVTFCVLNLISAASIQARKRRVFSLVVAGLNCIHMPLGTALGVFTFIVLLRDSVRDIYES